MLMLNDAFTSLNLQDISYVDHEFSSLFSSKNEVHNHISFDVESTLKQF